MSNFFSKFRFPLLMVFLACLLGLAFFISQTQAQIKPAISQAEVTPSVITKGEEVPILVRTIGTSVYGIESCQARALRDGILIYSFSLYDDGEHQDGVKGDEIFGNWIPKSQLETYSLGTYYVTIVAKDRAGNEAIREKAASFEIREVPVEEVPSLIEEVSPLIETEEELTYFQEKQANCQASGCTNSINFTCFLEQCSPTSDGTLTISLKGDYDAKGEAEKLTYSQEEEANCQASGCANSVTFICDKCSPTSDGILTIFLKGDYDAGDEFSQIYLDGQKLDKAGGFGGEDSCSWTEGGGCEEEVEKSEGHHCNTYGSKQFTIPQAELENYLSDGSLEVKLEDSSGVDHCCNASHRAKLDFSYYLPEESSQIYLDGQKLDKAGGFGGEDSCSWTEGGGCEEEVEKSEGHHCNTYGSKQFTIPQAELQFYLSDGSLEVKLEDSSVVDHCCNASHRAKLEFKYIIGENEKNLEQYSLKEVFLISDQNWQDVLPLVPVTIWTDRNGNIQKYPTLIYHRESTRFDADSIIYFLEQYSAQKVTAVGNLPAQLTGLINNLTLTPEIITPNDYFSYWSSFKDIIYVENNYELALLASTYASLINSPLIIQGTSLDSFGVFYGRAVILVGNVNCPTGATCNEQYNLEQLQGKYVEKTNTDKIILVNPNDLNIKVTETLYPEKSSGSISELYSKNSLAAPILASAKHEVILSTPKINYQQVDQFIEEKINNLNLNPKYLTIVANPNAIEMSYIGANEEWESADALYYSELQDGDPYLDFATGRILGITMSDVSAYIARSIFYEQTLQNPEEILVTGGFAWGYNAAMVYTWGKAISSIGYTPKVTPGGTQPEDWENRSLIIYSDHGGTDSVAGVSYSQIPQLDNSFMSVEACLTCAFEKASSKRELFCAHAIRKGAIGYIGAVDVSGYARQETLLAEYLGRGSSIGEAFRAARNAGDGCSGGMADQYTLIGDPTIKLNFSETFPTPTFTFLREENNKRVYNLTVPAMRFEIPQWVRDLCENKDTAPANLYFTTAFTNIAKEYHWSCERVGPFVNFSPENFDPPIIWGEKEIYRGEEYFWLTTPITVDPYFEDANDEDFTFYDFIFKLWE